MLAKSDTMMAVVKDLFGDDPKVCILEVEDFFFFLGLDVSENTIILAFCTCPQVF